MNRRLRKNLTYYLLLAVTAAAGLSVHHQYVMNQTPPADASAAAAEHLRAQKAATLIGFGLIWTISVALFTISAETDRRRHRRERQEDEQQTQGQTQDLIRTRDAIIFGLAQLAESRDQDTGHHLERISLYSSRLAAALRNHPRFRHAIDDDFIANISISSALHDIGKVDVPDSILLKPGRLTEDERAQMQLHTQQGANSIAGIQRQLGNSGFLEMAHDIALYHHERWDGTGYPHGLAQNQIPISARIVGLADVYDALSMRRVYKAAIPHDECVQIIRHESGKHFDPDIVDVFLAIENSFAEISRRFVDLIPHRPGRHEWPASERFSKELSSVVTRIHSDPAVVASSG